MPQPSDLPNNSAIEIAVIGSGFFGCAWVILFSRSSADVGRWDQAVGAADKVVDYISGVLDEMVHCYLLNGQKPSDFRGLITDPSQLSDAWANTDYIQETTSKILDLKNKFFLSSMPKHQGMQSWPVQRTAVLAASLAC